MNKKFYLILLFLTVTSSGVFSQESDQTELRFYGSIRLRTQWDVNSRLNNGDLLSDRHQFKFRFRFGLKYYKKYWKAAARIRSGNPAYPQSPDVLIGDVFKSKQLSIDKAYIEFHYNGYYIWAGKNSLNMWQPDQVLWDVDINPEGIGAGKTFHFLRSGALELKSGYFIWNNYQTIDDNNNIKKDDYIYFAQLKYKNFLFQNIRFKIAAGILNTQFTQTENPNMKYQIFSSYVYFKDFIKGLSLNFDYFYNLKDYKDLTNPAFENQKTGFAVQSKYRFSRKFSASVQYAYLEKYAVVDMLAQNDWVSQNTIISDTNGNLVYQYSNASNFKGININLLFHIDRDIQTGIELWNTKSILTTSDDKAIESNTRLRWNFKYRF